jgi:hypothetical protein
VKYLIYLDAALAAFGAVMSVTVGFVALAFGLYLDAGPKIRAGLGGVLAITGCFVVLSLIAGAAGWGLWRGRAWHWLAQGLLVLALPYLYLSIYANLQSP